MVCQLTALPHRAASDLVWTAVCCADSATVCAAICPDSVTWSGATRGACIATRIALTVPIRRHYDNIYEYKI